MDFTASWPLASLEATRGSITGYIASRSLEVIRGSDLQYWLGFQAFNHHLVDDKLIFEEI